MDNNDIKKLRKQFPSIQKILNGKNRVFLDGAGGTQVPQIVIDAMINYLVTNNSNQTGVFKTSLETEKLLVDVRKCVSDFINAPSWEEIIIGPNMTTITYGVVFAFSRLLKPGDEVVVSRLDHGANIDTWKALIDFGIKIKYLEVNPEDCTLDYELAEKIINPKTKLIAVGLASNAVGTVNDVKRLGQLAHNNGALIYIDAVHFAPHFPIDVMDLDCDFLVCSAYKFYGPHVGFAWGKREYLEMLKPYKPWPVFHKVPDKFSTGTPNMEGFAGAIAAIEFIAKLGEQYGYQFNSKFPGFSGRRLDIKKGMSVIAEHGIELGKRLMDGLKEIKGLRVYGITDSNKFDKRCPTFSFVKEGITSTEIARIMDKHDIYVWSAVDGFGALELVELLDVVEKYEGLLRVSIEIYNTEEEIDLFLDVLKSIKN